MSDSTRQCPACGASALSHYDRVCSRCGAALEGAAAAGGFEPGEGELHGESAPPPPSPPTRLRPRERIAALRSDPRLREALGARPSARSMATGHIAGAIFGAIFLAVAIFMWLRFRDVAAQAGAPVPSLITYVPLLFVAVGVWMLVFNLARALRLATAPLEALPAVVSSLRSETYDSGGRHRTRRHRHHITIEREDGERTELSAPRRLMGILRQDDIGVAYLKAGQLIDFARLED